MPRQVKQRTYETRVFQRRVSYMQYEAEKPWEICQENTLINFGFGVFQTDFSSVEMEQEKSSPTSWGKPSKTPLPPVSASTGRKVDTTVGSNGL